MPDLKELLGSAYKEGMTFDEASAALKDRKLVDLSSGEYVSKGKYDSAVKERDDARKERDDANTKYKDYDELVKYRKDAEAAKQAKEMADKIKGCGAKEDMIDFIKFQIDSGKIGRGKDDKDLEPNIKKFLKDNPQYAAQPGQPQPKPKITLGKQDPDGGSGNNADYTPAKVIKMQPWNRNRR